VRHDDQRYRGTGPLAERDVQSAHAALFSDGYFIWVEPGARVSFPVSQGPLSSIAVRSTRSSCRWFIRVNIGARLRANTTSSPESRQANAMDGRGTPGGVHRVRRLAVRASPDGRPAQLFSPKVSHLGLLRRPSGTYAASEMSRSWKSTWKLHEVTASVRPSS